MTREEMMKISWKAYQEILYKHPRASKPILCLLVEIDFDEESMTLQPMFGEDYKRQDFISAIQHCSIPPKKMAVKTIDGKTINKENILPEYEGSTNRLNPNYVYENIDDAS